MGTEIVWSDEKIRGIVNMIMPLNCTLKMVKMAKFMLYIFYHNFF